MVAAMVCIFALNQRAFQYWIAWGDERPGRVFGGSRLPTRSSRANHIIEGIVPQ